MECPSFFKNSKGTSLLELMVVTGIMSIIMAGISGTMISLMGMQTKAVIKKSAADVAYNLTSHLKNNLAWAATVAVASGGSTNASLECIKLNTDSNPANDMDCTGKSGNFNLYDSSGNAVYSPWNGDMTTANANGFSENGAPCSSYDGVAGDDDCPFRMELSWVAGCGGGFCLTPAITITGTFNYSPTFDRRVIMNTSFYDLSFVRGTENDLWQPTGIDLYREFGSVGIGITSPTSKVDVFGDGSTAATSSLNIESSTSVTLLFVRDDGNVGVGTSTPGSMFQVGSATNQGDIRIEGTGTTCIIGNGVGATSCTSDLKLKKNVVAIPKSLERIRKIRGVMFDWVDSYRKGGRRNMGVVAQEIEKVFPSSVHRDPVTKHKMVDFTSLIFPLIEATKEIAKNCEGTERKLGALLQRQQDLVRQVAESTRTLAKMRKQIGNDRKRTFKKLPLRNSGRGN